MNRPLNESVAVNPRFARSANIERDKGVEALRGYVPTGRAIDVVRRVGLGLQDSAAGRTFSITGPHGGGKSSMALFLGALLAERKSAEHKTAFDLLREVDDEAAQVLLQGLETVSPSGKGFAQALVTASREPVSETLTRAIRQLKSAKAGRTAKQSSVDVLGRFAKSTPTLIIIDEFGKNLEAFAEGDAEGDPYLLQELAELSQGSSALPLVVVTMQHLAFDEYVTSAGTAQRREWAKVQGRFQDIPFVESPEQSRRLIASAVSVEDEALSESISAWVDENTKRASELGLASEMEATSSAYPLHPVVLAALPELCARFGQNERTLFSFMAGPEPRAVPSFLAGRTWSSDDPLDFVGLDRVYDYFLESAGSSVGASGSASRWLEIENRLRDTWGLDETETAVLKAMGVLNLVSSSGTLRASKPLLEFALNPSAQSKQTREIRKALKSLEKRGIITYRDFSDEYRVWQGSDYDLHGSIEVARAEAQGLSLVEVLNRTVELSPAVAGRHSQQRGTLRVFDKVFVDKSVLSAVLEVGEEFDGRILLATQPLQVKEIASIKSSKPIVCAIPDDVEGVRGLAVEVRALAVAIERARDSEADWVALRELSERLSIARLELNQRVFEAWLPRNSQWISTVVSQAGGSTKVISLPPEGTVSSHLSIVSDDNYGMAPRIANEMLARRELTSQGAKARRLLIEALIQQNDQETIGLAGYGPERAMYEALLRSPGFHRKINDEWRVTEPADHDWQRLWERLSDAVEETSIERKTVAELVSPLKQPPFGLKDGLLPVLVVALLIEMADDVALYEHGSLVLGLDDAVAERLAKNPTNFAVKFVGATKGLRRSVVQALASELEMVTPTGEPTFLQVVRAVFAWLKKLPPYSQDVDGLLSPEATAVRDAFKTAVEPDDLFFVVLPQAVGLKEFAASPRADRARAGTFASRLLEALRELTNLYPALLDNLQQEIAQRTGTPASNTAELRSKLAGQGVNLEGRILEPRLAAFVGSLTRDHLADDAWIENVAMVVAEGVPPRSWKGETRAKFTRNLDELGGQLRRTQALLYENLSWDGEGFETRRITVTSPTGEEVSDVLSLRVSEIGELEEILRSALEETTARYGSRENAVRAILALLTMDAAPSSVQNETSTEKGA